MLIILSIIMSSLILISGVLLLCSPGTVQPLRDENGKPLVGSISEKIHVNIKGVEQRIFISTRFSNFVQCGHSTIDDDTGANDR